MRTTVEAEIDEQGNVRLLEPMKLTTRRRALVTILDSDDRTDAGETALLSERALAEDWAKPEEDAAWADLQQPEP